MTAFGIGPSQQLWFEIQVETPQAILGADGAATIARCVHAAPGRLSGLHYGTYDYSAALGIAAAHQSMEHPAADYAKAVMQVAAAGTGVRLVDGSTNVLPVGTRDEVVAAWRLHSRLVRRSLERGFYQGWDLHPAQLVTPLRRHLRLLPRRPAQRRCPPARLLPEIGRRPGRTSHHPRPGRLPQPSPRLRRRRRTRTGRRNRPRSPSS